MFVPAAWLLYQIAAEQFGPVPLGGMTYWSGLWATALLMLALAITPAQTIFRWGRLIIVRRIRISGSGNATYKDVQIALHLLATKAVKPFIGCVLPFPRVSEGHAMMERRAVVGRVVLNGW